MKTCEKNPFGLKYEQHTLNLLVLDAIGGYTELPMEFNWRPKYVWSLRKTMIGGIWPYILHLPGARDYTMLKLLYEFAGIHRFGLDAGELLQY